MLLKPAFCSSTVGVMLDTRSDGRLFNSARLKGKSKVKKITVQETALCWWCCTRSSLLKICRQLNQFSSVCPEFGPTISLKKTKVLSQGTDIPPTIKTEDKYIKNVKNFVYLGSSIASNAFMDTDINIRIGKASRTFARLSGRVWDNPKLIIRTMSAVYRACVCSILLYGSEMWTLSTMQEKKINTFHQRCLHRILRIKWQHKITNEEVLRRTGLTTIYNTLSQRRLRWLGHVLRMNDERIPKALLYSELVVGKRNVGRPRLRYKDVCKCDLKSLKMFTLMTGKGLRTIGTNGALLSWRDYVRRKIFFLRNQRRRQRNQNLFFFLHVVYCYY